MPAIRGYAHQRAYRDIRSPERVTRIVEVWRAGEKIEGYERHEESPDEAIDAVVDHARFMTKQGAWPGGRYIVKIGGESGAKREVRLVGPPQERVMGHIGEANGMVYGLRST
jgi:hypothetical protein